MGKAYSEANFSSLEILSQNATVAVNLIDDQIAELTAYFTCVMNIKNNKQLIITDPDTVNIITGVTKEDPQGRNVWQTEESKKLRL